MVSCRKQTGRWGHRLFPGQRKCTGSWKLVLSIKSGDSFYHFPIERGVGSYRVEGTEEPFPSLVELIDHYKQHGLPESDR